MRPLFAAGEVSTLEERSSPTHDGRNVIDTTDTRSANDRTLAASNQYYAHVDDPHVSNPIPEPSFFLPQETSVASRLSIPTKATANNSLHQFGSLNLDPAESEAAYLQGTGLGTHYGQSHRETPVKRNRRSRVFLISAGLLVIILAVICGAYFGVTRHRKPTSHDSASPSVSGTPASNIIYGGDGTVVVTEQGSKFTYNNSFGGYFVVDPGNPFNNDARAQSWSPPLNQSWQFGKDQILGCANYV